MTGENLRQRLVRWGYGKEINERVGPILEMTEGGDVATFQRRLFELASRVLGELEEGSIAAKQADDIFMVIDLYVTELDLRERLVEETRQLIMEGLHLHHYGSVHGPSVELMRKLINEGSGKI